MINTTVIFYNVGLSDKNLAYDWDALNRILAAGLITDNGQAYELHLTALPFGQVFNISQDVYDKVKTATYIVIENTDPEKPNATPDARGCFINNFLQLANGNWSVSYTIDDWASYYLNPDSPYNIHIDGFTERANVPLLKDGKFTTADLPLTGELDKKIYKTFKQITGAPISTPTHNLPNGYRCAVYFINQPHYDGTPKDKTAHGTINDYNVRLNSVREIRRDNSNIYFMIFKADGYNAPIWRNDNSVLLNGGVFQYWQVNDASIEKIMYFDFIPSLDGTDFIKIINGVVVLQTNDTWEIEDKLADIIHVDSNILNPSIYGTQYNGYYKAIKITRFIPAIEFKIKDLVDADLLTCEFTTYNIELNYNSFLAHSLYQYIDEYRFIKIKYMDIELNMPIEFLNIYTRFIVGISGDAETIILKIKDTAYSLGSLGNTNRFAATGQNTDYFDLVHVRDFKAYKNAKITGAAGLAATAIGSVTALGSSIASGNVAGVVGSLAGGAQGIISGVQKLQGLTPAQQSPANGDITLTRILENTELTKQLTVEEYTVAPNNKLAQKRYFEENGAAVSMPFDDYISNCQMEAFNAIKMAIIDVTGAPQQICRRIEETFLNGVTLWTSTDVGNKKVINYPLNS